MSDKIHELLEKIVNLSNCYVVDECPRSGSEPYISIWEVAKKMAEQRLFNLVMDPETGDYRIPVHASPDDVIDKLEALCQRLSETNQDPRGLYGDMISIRESLTRELRFHD